MRSPACCRRRSRPSAAGRGLICPAAQGSEAAWAGDLEVLAPASIIALVNHFKGSQILARPSPADAGDLAVHPLDLADIKGQETAKRALEVAAAGGHNLLMVGPPGAGKSMLAQRLPGLLPPLDPAAALEVSMIHSVAGQLAGGRLMRNRPFRDPHHSASLPSLIGGGLRAKPGEVSLAHHGVLFLDELPEFARATLEALRQPLESGRAVVARVNAHVTYPARFQLVAAMNPCRCGHLDDASLACGRAPKCAQEYQAKISGPLFDRIDMHVDVPAVSPADLALPPPREGSKQVAARVAAAREIQAARYAGKEIRSNAEADGQLLDEVATPDAEGRKLLAAAAERFRLSARGYHRVLRVARTLADLEAQRRRPPGACGGGAELSADRAGAELSFGRRPARDARHLSITTTKPGANPPLRISRWRNSRQAARPAAFILGRSLTADSLQKQISGVR